MVEKYMRTKSVMFLALLSTSIVDADPFDVAMARAKEFCAQMTIEEKRGELMVYDYACLGKDRWGTFTNYVNQNQLGALMRVRDVSLLRRMQDYKLAHSRLKIPLIIHEDIVNGWKTTLPRPLAMACSWNDALVECAEAVAAREAAAIGIQVTYAPQVDVSNDPRWGRIDGCLGEDPYLAGRIGAARVRGDQGRTLDELTDGRHVISCIKHYIGYPSLQAARDYRHMDFSRRELFETHLPPFKACVDAGAMAVMSAYTPFEGVPLNFNRYLLQDVLRGQLCFRGQLITDWATFNYSIREGAAEDYDDSAIRGIAAGVEMDMLSGAYPRIPRLVKAGRIRESDVDPLVVKCLAMKFLMGLMDDPYRYCNEERARTEVYSERNQREVLELARASIMLLKNEHGILPLDPTSRVGLTGSWADDPVAQRGGMFKDNPNETVRDGEIFRNAGETITIRGAMARRWGANLEYAGEGVPEADTVVLSIGEPHNYTGERKNRAKIELPESELEHLRQLRRAGKRIVSVIFAGRPFMMNEIVEASDAVLMAWYPGTMGGEALGEILSGEVNPSGKLAIHIPRHVGQIPLSYREKRTFTVCPYGDLPDSPLFPFGYGLSYTTFSYGTPKVPNVEMQIGSPVPVTVRVKNTGKIAGREIIQLYVRDEVASVLPRERELKEFTSVWLKPGEEKEVTFSLPPDAFSLYDQNLKRVIEPGAFTVFVGPDSTTTNAVRIVLK